VYGANAEVSWARCHERPALRVIARPHIVAGSAEAHRGEQPAARGWRSTRWAPVLAAELGIPKIGAV
jgi:hypothetical protein